MSTSAQSLPFSSPAQSGASPYFPIGASPDAQPVAHASRARLRAPSEYRVTALGAERDLTRLQSNCSLQMTPFVVLRFLLRRETEYTRVPLLFAMPTVKHGTSPSSRTAEKSGSKTAALRSPDTRRKTASSGSGFYHTSPHHRSRGKPEGVAGLIK